MKVIFSLALLVSIVACSSVRENEFTYYCRDTEWEYLFNIYDERSGEVCLESTRINQGRLMVGPMEKPIGLCRKVIKKQSRKKKCCVVSYPKEHKDIKLPLCRPGVADLD